MDSKMKKMAELQLSVVSDPKNRKAIENQVHLQGFPPIAYVTPGKLRRGSWFPHLCGEWFLWLFGSST